VNNKMDKQKKGVGSLLCIVCFVCFFRIQRISVLAQFRIATIKNLDNSK
jgi:hypothetical protein